jgi:hypothetical protein
MVICIFSRSSACHPRRKPSGIRSGHKEKRGAVTGAVASTSLCVLAFLLADAGWTRTYFMAIGAEAFLLMAALLVASAVIVRLRRTSNEGARNAG